MSPCAFVLTTALTLVLLVKTGFSQTAISEDVAPLNLVSDQAAVCLEIPGLAATWSQFRDSQLLTRLKQFPPIERLLSGAGVQKWKLVEDHVRRVSGKGLSEQLLGAFSQSLVVAIYVPDDSPPQGVLIGQARDTAALNQAIQTWNQLDAQQESQTRVHHGRSYIRRAKTAKSNEIVYYTLIGRTIALSDQERRIQEIIELRAADEKGQGGATGLLISSNLYRSNRARLPADAAASLFLNARQWDRVVGGAIEKSPDARWIAPVFRQVAAITVSLRLKEEFVVDLMTDITGGPTEMLLPFVSATKGGRDWSRRIPADAILAVSSRMDVGPLIKRWLATSPETRTNDFAKGRNLARSLLQGRDLFLDVLPIVLRDWTVSLNVADPESPGEAPLNVLGRFHLAPDEANQSPATEALDQALQFGMTLLAATVSHQRGIDAVPVIVNSNRSETGVTRVLEGMPPWSHGYQLTPKQLFVSTSSSVLAQQRDEIGAGNSRRFERNSQRYFDKASQLAWLDSVQLCRVIGQQQEWIANQVTSNSETRERLRKHLSKVEEVAKIFDAAFVAATFDEEYVRISFGVSLDRRD